MRNRYSTIVGDCVGVMAGMPAGSVDAIVTDPPYGLEFMGKEWDRLGDVGQASHTGFADEKGFKGFRLASYSGSANVKCGRCRKWKWDHDGRKCDCGPEAIWPNVKALEGARMQAWHEAWALEALRVLKPGGHLLAFGGTRTYHRLACAIEDAGFEIRDTLAWMYGSGFPKSLDVSKAIDKAAGAEREEGGREWSGGQRRAGILGDNLGTQTRTIYDTPATPQAEQWQGWGTALKPAHEPIALARKPLTGTVAGNVQAHGTGALNIDGCRIGSSKAIPAWTSGAGSYGGNPNGQAATDSGMDANVGRWPANVILDPAAAAILDQQTGELTSGRLDRAGITAPNLTYGAAPKVREGVYEQDTGGASRFYYVPKASSAERNAGLDGFEEKATRDTYGDGLQGPRPHTAPDYEWQRKGARNTHPTVKPVQLMRWLCRLVTPPGGTVLDPFCGSGTTGIAATLEGFRFVGIERDPDYARIAEARIRWWQQHPDGMELVRRLEFEAAQTVARDSGQLDLFGAADP